MSTVMVPVSCDSHDVYVSEFTEISPNIFEVASLYCDDCNSTYFAFGNMELEIMDLSLNTTERLAPLSDWEG